MDEEVRAWRGLAAASQLGVEVIDPPAPLDRIRTALADMPLIDERRFVLVRDPPQLGGGRRPGEAGRELALALELRAPSTSVCLVSHEQVPATHPVASAVTRLGGEVRLRNPLRGRELRAWAQQHAQSRGVRLPSGGLDHLLRVAGSDLGIISAEIDKLSSYEAGGPPRPESSPGAASEVDLETLRRLVGGAEGIEVWNVLERLLGPEPARGAAAALELTDAGRSTVYLIATLAGQLSELRRAQSVLNSGVAPSALASRLRVPEWRAERLARQARAVPSAVVEQWLRDLLRLDVAVKSGEADEREGVGPFILRASRTLADARRR
ncbi:MAG TPA: hypothetical protein VEK76_10060 [Candidatus Binatia bacterium]|nr:hypothetical protein [Candidatus Binatia bacterium]